MLTSARQVDGANFLFGLTDKVPSDRTLEDYDPLLCARGEVRAARRGPWDKSDPKRRVPSCSFQAL